MDLMALLILVGAVAFVLGGLFGYSNCPKPASPPVVELRPVFGDAHTATLYSVWAEDKTGGYVEHGDGSRTYHEGETRYYATCEQAHAEFPGADVSAIQAIRVGDDLIAGKFAIVKVQPKPKVAKGKR